MLYLVFLIAGLYVLLCPFTKVEESFNIQAIHDILFCKHNLSKYDHNEFPGVVPRTFLGPLFISALSSPMVMILNIFKVDKSWIQLVVRLILALTVVAAWNQVKAAFQKILGTSTAWWYALITVTQYHFMFYISRPLPNIMAMPLVLLSFEGWLLGKQKQFILYAGAAIIIFRSELAILFGLYLIIDLNFKKTNIYQFLKIAAPAGLGLVTLTVIVDSIFWGRLLWPEAEVFWFNTVLNKSSDWGTSPFLWYFYSALPRGLGPSLVLIPIGLYLDRRLIQIVIPALVYVVFYSFLPHKELRFIIYVFPLLNIASASVCSYVFIRRTKAPIYELMFWAICMIIVGNILLSSIFLSVATLNYPGGLAITKLHKLLKNESFVHVHICNLAAQTGVTRFLELNDNWKYSKNESLQDQELQLYYTHLIVESKSKYSSNLKVFSQTHTTLDAVEMFSQISMNYKLFPPIRIKTKPVLFLLEKKDFRNYISDNREIKNLAPPTESALDLDSYIKKNEIDDHKKIDEIQSGNNENESFYINEVDVKKDSNYDIDTLDVDKTSLEQKSSDESNNFEKPPKRSESQIKAETQKYIIASAKAKIREIMKEYRNDQEKTSFEENPDDNLKDGMDLAPNDNDINDFDSRNSHLESNNDYEKTSNSLSDSNQNIEAIVEEVVLRLIDIKFSNDKTRPSEVENEDKIMIQQLVKEILFKKTNSSLS